VFVPDKPFQTNDLLHSVLLEQLLSYKENEVLWILSLVLKDWCSSIVVHWPWIIILTSCWMKARPGQTVTKMNQWRIKINYFLNIFWTGIWFLGITQHKDFNTVLCGSLSEVLPLKKLFCFNCCSLAMDTPPEKDEQWQKWLIVK
jgi:hypothetical protein